MPISGTVTGPFTIAAMVMGTEQLMIGMIKSRRNQAADGGDYRNNNRYIQRLIDLGVGIGFADPVSPTALSASSNMKPSLPYFQKNVDFLLKKVQALHDICGISRALWSCSEKDRDWYFILIMEDMQEAKEVLGSHMCIQGNVPPVEVTCMGTPQDVAVQQENVSEKRGDSVWLCFNLRLPNADGTPRENMTALMDAARIPGSYPLQMDLLFDEAE